MTPEGRTKTAVKAVLKAKGIWYYMPVQNGMGISGVPDFVCCWNGRMLVVETKALGKRNATTENQKRVMFDIQAHGGLAIVVDDVQQLTDFLEQHNADQT